MGCRVYSVLKRDERVVVYVEMEKTGEKAALSSSEYYPSTHIKELREHSNLSQAYFHSYNR
jgi:DNA-binding transcriptional regulator YiaG